MSNKKIKCSYEDCFRHFKDYESMVKHKDQEPEHDYCKKCDLDCKDDLAMLIHQISSPKHIACPICGVEFQSMSGRDSHVEVSHPRKQDLDCAGCGEKFTKASAVMRHIENDECNVIRLEHFERQRAEKQILKDAWESALDPTGGSVLRSKHGVSEADTNGGVSLMDDDRPPIQAWDGSTRLGAALKPLPNGQNSSSRMPAELNKAMEHLTTERFPALPAQQKVDRSRANEHRTAQAAGNSDLVDFTQPEERIKNRAPTKGSWTKSENNSKTLFPARSVPLSNLTPSQLGPLESMSNLTAATHGTHNYYIPPAARPTNKDPNAAHGHLQTAPQLTPPSMIDPYQYLHPIEQKFICPGQKCGRKFDSPESFSAHLLTGAHVGGRTQCPSCLKKFNSTAALIAHCESGNKRCTIRKSLNYNQVMRELTGGLIGTDGHLQDGTVRYTANKVQDW